MRKEKRIQCLWENIQPCLIIITSCWLSPERNTLIIIGDEDCEHWLQSALISSLYLRHQLVNILFTITRGITTLSLLRPPNIHHLASHSPLKMFSIVKCEKDCHNPSPSPKVPCVKLSSNFHNSWFRIRKFVSNWKLRSLFRIVTKSSPTLVEEIIFVLLAAF